MMTAMCAARNILGANYDLWAINTEAEYHEEEQEKSAAPAEIGVRRPAYAEPPLVPGSAHATEGHHSPVAAEVRAAKASAQGASSTL